MNMDVISSWILAAFGVAMVTTLVIHPQTAKVITSFGSALSQTVKASMGK